MMASPAGSRLAAVLLGMGLLLGAGGCDLDRNEGVLMAAGSYGDLAVVLGDESLRPGVQAFLDRLNRPVSFVIRAEAPYQIDIFTARQWKISRNYKNILMVAVWDGQGRLHKEIRRLLSERTRMRFQESGGGIAQLRDPYARYQFGLIVTASDRNSLMSLLNRKVEEIRDKIEEQNRLRINRRFLRDGIHEKQRDRYWQAFDFTIDMPQIYRENQVKPGGFAAIEWMRNAPSRGITLAWREFPDPAAVYADNAALLAWRRQIGEIVHKEDLVDMSLVWADTTLAGRPCRKLTGAWNGRNFDGGGPFWCYFLSDPRGERLFCLDILVYAPGQDKLPYFREMQAVASTFSLQQPSR